MSTFKAKLKLATLEQETSKFRFLNSLANAINPPTSAVEQPQVAAPKDHSTRPKTAKKLPQQKKRKAVLQEASDSEKTSDETPELTLPHRKNFADEQTHLFRGGELKRWQNKLLSLPTEALAQLLYQALPREYTVRWCLSPISMNHVMGEMWFYFSED